METTKFFINSLNFESFETYSFQRGENYVATHLIHLLDDNKALHPTGAMISRINKTDAEFAELLEIFNTEIEEDIPYLCAPIYRDAILFLDKDNKVISHVDICFECDRIERENKHKIKTDFKTFKMLKIFLHGLGHPIEDPNEFKADYIIEMMNKLKPKTAKS
jgi:hypothetical protein